MKNYLGGKFPMPIVGGLLVFGLLFGGSRNYNKGHAGPGLKFGDGTVAYFDDFSYKGFDYFYTDNPLPGPDYFYNPILPGWYSDPSVCVNGDDYFLVTSSFSYFPGVPVFHSKDLVNWQQIGHVLDRPSQLPLDGQKTSEGIFAPAIGYNPHNETYYMVTTNIKRGNFFVTTKNPFDGWSDPVWLPEVGGIDPSLFFDDDGKAYIVNNEVPDGGSLYDGHRAICIREFDPETGQTIGPRKMIVNGGVNLDEKPVWIEGPHLYKIRGKYLLMCAEGGTSVNHREVIFRADAPMGPFTPVKENPILTQKHLDPNRELPITCTGHADLIQKSNGDWWSVFLGCRPINNQFENLGRETFLMPVRWSEGGVPYMTQGDEEVPRIVRMEGLQRDKQTTFGNFQKTETFDGSELGYDWLTLRGPAKELYSLTYKPGFLSLKCAEVSSREQKEPAYISRRIQHHQFEVKTTLLFDSKDEKDLAGLLLYKDESHQYLFSIQTRGSSRVAVVEKISGQGNEVLADTELPMGPFPVQLKVMSDGPDFNFYCSTADDKGWTEVATGIDAYYLSTANSFGFTGTSIGMYAAKAY